MEITTGAKVSLGESFQPAEERAWEITGHALSGLRVRRLTRTGLFPEGAPRVVIGTPQTSQAVSQWVQRRQVALPRYDGFHVQYDGEDKAIYIISGEPRGCIYGALWLEEALVLGEAGLANELTAGHGESPVFKYRSGGGRKSGMEGMLRARGNIGGAGILPEMPHWKFRELLEAETGEKLTPPEIDEAAIARSNEAIAECHRWGIWAGASRNQVEIGRASLEERPYLVQEVLKVHPEYKFSPTHNACQSIICTAYPHFWEVLEANIEEIFHYYPGIDMFTLTTADNGGEIFCNCRRCRHIRYEERVRRFIETVYETMKRVQPNCLLVMRMHNIGDWYWYNCRIDMDRIARDLPKDMAFSMKFSCPPTFDLAWTTDPGYWIGRLEQDLIVHIGYDNSGKLPSTLFFASIANRIKQDVEYLAEQGVEGVMLGSSDAPFTAHLADIADKLRWDPRGVDVGEIQAAWARKRFGRKAGRYAAEALRRSEEIASKVQPVPWVINSVKNLNPWREYDQLRAPYPRLIYEGKKTTLLETLSGSREFAPANVRKALKQIDATATAWKVHDLFKAAKESAPDDNLLDFYAKISEDTARYAEIFKGYVGGYLQWRLSGAARGESAKRALDEAFLDLLRAQTSWHLMSGLESVPWREFKDYTGHYMWYITRELDGFDWLPHLPYVLDAVAAGETLVVFAGDVLRRDVEGFFLVPLLGLEEEGDQIRVPEDTRFFAVDKAALSEEELDLWYCELEMFVREHGEGRIIYTNLEERDPWYTTPKSPPTPAIGRKEKRQFKELLSRLGLLPGQVKTGKGLKPYRDLLRWEGPYYNAGNYIETTRLYKLRRDDGSKWA